MRRGLVLLIAGLWLVVGTAQAGTERQRESYPGADGFTNLCNAENVTIFGTNTVNNRTTSRSDGSGTFDYRQTFTGSEIGDQSNVYDVTRLERRKGSWTPESSEHTYTYRLRMHSATAPDYFRESIHHVQGDSVEVISEREECTG